MRLRRRWLIVGIAAGVFVTLLIAAIAATVPFTSEAARTRVVSTLEARFEAKVELAELTFRLLPRPHASGRGLVISPLEHPDVPPLVSIDRFDVEASIPGLWRGHIAHVSLAGLSINIPPDPDDEPDQSAVAVSNRADNAETKKRRLAAFRSMDRDMRLVIDRLDAPDSTLTILRDEPHKAPRVWYMHRLTMWVVGPGNRMPFETLLTNAVPPGEILASGSVGPWNREEPGRTPLDGKFTFENADLSVFKGISGILSARGRFDGTFNRIQVDGQTLTPDFSVTLSGHAVPLTTTYHAVVDATNGNTTLDPVLATVLSTNITARGGVYDVPDADGRMVQMDVTIEDGRLEDVMRLAVHTPAPPMRGRLRLRTALTIPPGPQDIIEKLKLKGEFAIGNGRFTNAEVQRKVDTLSERASVRKVADTEAASRVPSDFSGLFVLDSGRLSLSSFAFNVPGAVVKLDGSYALRPETLAFIGELQMDAKLSQTTTGLKSLLLKIVDPIFRHNGRTVLPLRISGTRNDPEFGLDKKRVFRR
jgi:hypothetical protein